MSGAEEHPSIVEVEISYLLRSEPQYSYRDEDEDVQESENFKISLPGTEPLSILWTKLQDAGFKIPIELSDENGNKWNEFSKKTIVEPFEEVKVIEGVSTVPAAIGLDERLIAFTNRHFGTPLQLNIDEEPTSHGSSSDCLKDVSGLKITFLRTARMPDDNKLHPLPAALGTFPLQSVGAFAKALPDKMVRAGGVFIPMWQREALWVGLECRTMMEYALRVYVGRINAVSGEEMKAMNHKEGQSRPLQDYVIVPGQQWLDGICVGPGVVRQFVAMPLGSGYTVEGQKTGEEKHGGLQIEIIPAFQTDLRDWFLDSNVADDSGTFSKSFDGFARVTSLDELSTPRDLGLELGTRLRLYPSPACKEMPYSLSDIFSTEKKLVQLLASYPFEYEYGSSDSDIPRWSTSQRGSIHILDHLSDGSGDDEDAGIDSNYDHSNDANVNTAEKNLRSMGLAAGGKLMQDIIEDFNAPETWNTAGSRLVNIHILDPVSYEAVTHIVPAPPPMDAETYAKSNMPFFVLEEKPDERLGGGDFHNVKSVSAMDKEKGVSEEQSLDPRKPVQCKCGVRLCDCAIRPCNHTFCHVCIKEIDPQGAISWSSAEPTQKADWKCPICQAQVAYVAGFSTPMNLPGEETIKMRVPVNVLEVRDGRPAFKSVHKARI